MSELVQFQFNRKIKKGCYVEIEFSNRENGTFFKEYLITDKKLIKDIEEDEFMALDYLDSIYEDVDAVANHESFDYSFVDRLAIAINKAGLDEAQCKSFLLAINDVKEYLWKFNSRDREDFCLKIWEIKSTAFNDGSKMVLERWQKANASFAKPTETGKRLAELKQLQLDHQSRISCNVIFDKDDDGIWHIRDNAYEGKESDLKVDTWFGARLDEYANDEIDIRLHITNIQPSHACLAIIEYMHDVQDGSIYSFDSEKPPLLLSHAVCNVVKHLFKNSMPKKIYISNL